MPLPLTRDLVFVGGGHTHALVLRKWAMHPLPGVRLTLISPGPTAPYSGMLPGFVAGHYPREALDIDLIRLTRFAGARLVLGTVEGISPDTKRIHITGQGDIPYDVASVNVGITSEMPLLDGFTEFGVPVKPLGPFATHWDHYRRTARAPRVAVLGAGVAGAEVAMAMAHALRDRAPEVHLIDRSAPLSEVTPAIRSRLLHALDQTGVHVHPHTQVEAVTATGLRLADGRDLPAEFVTGATGARPYDWLAQIGVETREGFITVAPSLQSSDPALFAAGDCAHLRHAPRPKAGVYAVREAPILWHNLRAALRESGNMQSYHPQKDYLKLISLGGKKALAARFGQALSGAALWRWKDHIDQRFMNRFRDLPEMSPPAPRVTAAGMKEAQGPKPMCAGCGAKIGRSALNAGLARLHPTPRSDIESLPGDDAAILRIAGQRQVLTTDHLRAFVEDPVLMTRIAANHALGDIWAMGGAPQAAVLSVTLPRLSEALQARSMEMILTAAEAEITRAGAALVGGHSSMGAEMSIGFAITGLVETPLTLAGAQAGDALILTKPIGSGTIMAAEMARQAPPDSVTACWDHMVRPQDQAARLLAPVAHAMTDVTGFGLAGHLSGIADASGLGAEITLADVPLMDGAEALAQAGVRSSLYSDNRAASGVVIAPDTARAALMYDPQTAGGLLAAIPMDQAYATLSTLRAAGLPAERIGKMTEGAGVVLR